MDSKSDRTLTGYVSIYHVTDAGGMHKFLTINSLRVEALGGTGVFEQILARQYETFELLGTTPVVSPEDDPRTVKFPDARGAEELHERVRKTMAAYPNSSGCLESWQPERKGPAKPYSTPVDQLPWRPISELKKKRPSLDLERVVLVLSGAPIEDLVKPECISVVRARGGMKLSELKKEVRQIVEPAMIRAWSE